MADKIVITGMGVISPLGAGIEEYLENLKSGSSGIAKLSALNTDKLHTLIGGEIKDDVVADIWSDEKPLEEFDRSTVLSIIASDMAVSDAMIQQTEGLPLNRGIVIGSEFGPILSQQDAYRKVLQDNVANLPPMTVTRTLPSATASLLSRRYQFSRICNTVSSACSSALVALGVAMRHIECGDADIMLVGGVDTPISEVLYRAWDSYRVMTRDYNDSPQLASRPFSADHNGMVLSEGSGFIVLERESIATQRGAEIYAELAGLGQSSSAADLVSPNAEALSSCMAEALAGACLARNELDCLFAHAPSIPNYDDLEKQAIVDVFGDLSSKLPVTAIKSMLGHSMGASGIFSVIAAILSLREGFIPPTVNVQNTEENSEIDLVTENARHVSVKSAMVNAFGFGGANVSVILRKA